MIQANFLAGTKITKLIIRLTKQLLLDYFVCFINKN